MRDGGDYWKILDVGHLIKSLERMHALPLFIAGLREEMRENHLGALNRVLGLFILDRNSMRERDWIILGAVLPVMAGCATAGMCQEVERKSVAVRHPNLLLNKAEIDEIKVRVRDHEWAARVARAVKAKAEKDNAVVEGGLAYVLTGEARYARRVRNGQSAVQFPMRSVDEVSLSFTTRDELPK